MLDDHTDWVKKQYAKFASEAMFKGTEKSYSSVHDTLIYKMLPVFAKDSDWLHKVRHTVILYRGHWLKALSLFYNKHKHYIDLSLKSVTSKQASKQAELIENSLDANRNTLYSVLLEVKYNLDRCRDITERLVRPYLRKVVSMARMYAREPEAFFENYQNGYHGVLMAIGRYNTNIGAYAFIVSMWIQSSMVGGITKLSNTINFPDKTWKHKRLFDKHPNMSYADISKKYGIEVDSLEDSANLLEARNAMPLLEENDEEADGLEAYHDKSTEHEHQLNQAIQQIILFGSRLSSVNKAILSILFDTDALISEPDKDELRRETYRQLSLQLVS
jgi:DNA-directed RNA polymerase sigma subunit (sigma70/sigma32)